MRTFIIIILSVFTMSCTTQKLAKNSLPNFIEIKFGSGGGFTGMTNEYVLQQDGQVYKRISNKLSLINRIQNSELENIEKKLVEMNFESIQLNEKGNMTYFIEVHTSTYTHRITWSDNTQNDSTKQFYKSLITLINK